MGKALAFDHIQLAMPRGEEAAARAFYGRVLGLVEIPKPVPLAARGFAVDDLDAFAKDLEAGGYRVVVDPVQLPGSRRIFTEDPFGNRVELTQRSIEG